MKYLNDYVIILKKILILQETHDMCSTEYCDLSEEMLFLGDLLCFEDRKYINNLYELCSEYLKAINLCKQDKIDKALDVIYNIIDDYLSNDKIKECDIFLNIVDGKNEPLTLVLGILTITNHAKHLLLNRSKIIKDFMSREGESKERLEKLVKGLK